MLRVLLVLLPLFQTTVSSPSCTIDSVSPSEIQTGSELVMTGSLVDTTNVQVDLGHGMECTVTVSTTSEIRCIVGVAIAGTYTPRIVYPKHGVECASSSTVQVPLVVTSLSTDATGVLGGATLVLTGQGFGKGDDSRHYVYVDGNGLCESFQRDDTKLTCITRPGSYGPNSAVWLAIAGISHITHSLPFTASEEYQPRMQNVFSEPAKGKDGTSSTLVHITGENLDGPGTAKISTADCVYVSSTSNQHICRLESGVEFPPGPLPVELTTVNRGRAAEGPSLGLTMKCDDRKRCCPSGSSCVVPQGMDFGSQKQCVKSTMGRLSSPDVVVPPVGCSSSTPVCPCVGDTQEPVKCKNGLVYDSQCLATCAGQDRCKPL